jgi:L-methionine (R)-S-oxide reductase
MDDDVIARLGLIVTREGSREERATRAAELVRRVTGARWVGIYTVTGTVVNCDGWSGPGAPAHPSFGVTEGLTAHAIRTGALALSNDVSRDPRYLANQDDSGSELIVPILVGGRVAGTLDVESDRSGAFSGSSIVEYERLHGVVSRDAAVEQLYSNTKSLMTGNSLWPPLSASP